MSSDFCFLSDLSSVQVFKSSLAKNFHQPVWQGFVCKKPRQKSNQRWPEQPQLPAELPRAAGLAREKQNNRGSQGCAAAERRQFRSIIHTWLLRRACQSKLPGFSSATRSVTQAVLSCGSETIPSYSRAWRSAGSLGAAAAAGGVCAAAAKWRLN